MCLQLTKTFLFNNFLRKVKSLKKVAKEKFIYYANQWWLFIEIRKERRILRLKEYVQQ